VTDRNRQKETVKDRNRQKQTVTDRNRQEQAETVSDRHKLTPFDGHYIVHLMTIIYFI
jgi:hypothetical protein